MTDVFRGQGLLFKVNGVSQSSPTFVAISFIMMALCVGFVICWGTIVVMLCSETMKLQQAAAVLMASPAVKRIKTTVKRQTLALQKRLGLKPRFDAYFATSLQKVSEFSRLCGGSASLHVIRCPLAYRTTLGKKPSLFLMFPCSSNPLF